MRDPITFDIPWTFTLSADANDSSWNDKGYWEDLFLSQLDSKGRHKYGRIEVQVNSPHAEYVEYGTERPRTTDQKPWKAFVKVIESWCKVKLDLSDTNPNIDKNGVVRTYKDGSARTRTRREVAYAIAYKVLNEGIPPQPFFRPAIYNVLTQCFDSDGLKPQYTLVDVADMLQSEMIRIYDSNDTAYGGPYRSEKDREIRSNINVQVIDPNLANSDARILGESTEWGELDSDIQAVDL